MMKNISLLIVFAYAAVIAATFFIKSDVSKQDIDKRVVVNDTASLRMAILNSINNPFSSGDTLAIDIQTDNYCGTLTEEERVAIKERMQSFPVRYYDMKLLDMHFRKELSARIGMFVITSNDLFWMRISQAADRYNKYNDSIQSKFIDSLNANIVFLTIDGTASGSRRVEVNERFKMGKSVEERTNTFIYKKGKWIPR